MNNIPSKPLTKLAGQPLCKHYTGATLENQTGDYSCKCLAGVSYDRFLTSMERWPCRRRHLLGLEQCKCDKADYGAGVSECVDAQVTKMFNDAI